MLRRIVVAVAAAAAVAACGGGWPPSSSPVPSVIAAEGFWGSIAAQLAGTHARVQSVVTDPNADPHEYESSANDARAFARADLVILNGAGYDDWGRRLLDAGGSPHRRVITVAGLLGRRNGDNPHLWYDPAAVTAVADRITGSLEAADPADAADLERLRAAFEVALGPYRDRIAEIGRRFGGVRVGATESVFVPMASALGLDLVSPPELMQAVSEGTEPPAGSLVAFQRQVQRREIRLLVYNVQTATEVTTTLRRAASAAGIPVVGVSETMQPETATFQDWQVSQLVALQDALSSDALAR